VDPPPEDRGDWVAELAPADTCVSSVYSIPELVDDPQFASRKAFLEAKHPERGSFRQVGPLLAGGDRGQPAHPVRPDSATDTEVLLREAGLDEGEIEKLRGAGIVE
jgi:crotonobetainyl-CoA:carnitine CoA-transferase CaiB-like acyl-CoA transferase